ncbi:MAG TPA: hypothetical protein VK837_12050 [Longimicrobiales bacterium]|nr:hypothetical protein [Longimicrobiales bacterium]
MLLVPALVLLSWPSPADAQFGVFDALARRFSDVSFFGSAGGLLPESDQLRSGTTTSFGVEVLFEIGSIERTLPASVRPDGDAPVDSVRIRWTGMQIIRSEDGVDTVYTYEVEPRPPPPPPTETVWVFELGVGYGQLSGFNARDSSLDLKGSIRSLPFLSLYGSYEPIGVYGGLRSGFMKTEGLQVFDSEGTVFSGDADSFLAGVVLGYAVELLGINVFAEGAYMVRDFPSVEWDGGPLPAGIPREMSLSGWTLGGGIQFSVGD